MGSMEERVRLLAAEETPNEEIGLDTSDSKQQCGGWKASSLILCTVLCQCIAITGGITNNLVMYLKTELLEDNIAAAAHASTWLGTCYLTTLVGAYLADSYWGNYLTIMVSCVFCFIGITVLTVSASLSVLKHTAFFSYLGLYMVSLGSGSIKPCLSAFGADQFYKNNASAKASFFKWYFLCIKIGSFLASTVIVWIQDNYGWTIGFGIPTLIIGIGFMGFMAGSRFYRKRKPNGSPFARLCQVIVAASRKSNLDLPEDVSLLYQAKEKSEHTPEFSCLDKAAIVSTSHDLSISGAVNPWSLCAMSQVEELKAILRLLPIWATFILFASVSTQESSVFVEQGMVMDTRFGSFKIPPASLSCFNVISVVVFTPIYDKIVVPVARKFTGKERGISHLQRCGIGLLFSVLAMATAALVETKRLQIARDEGLVHQKVEVPMSIFWQVPQFFLVGVGEVFNQIGMLEFFYDQAPDSMRSLCLALALFTISLGSYVTSLILTVIDQLTTWIPDNLNEGHLDRFFWLLAGLCSVNLLVFSYCASKYRYKRN